MKEQKSNIWSRNQWIRMTFRQKLWGILAITFLCLAGGLIVLAGMIQGILLSQKMADRWDSQRGSAQISCFFSDEINVIPDTIRAFEYTLENHLKESLIQASNKSARLWVDAYSAKGKIILTSSSASVQVGAYGVGGDFFLFHPLNLEPGGMYFDGDDLMKDYVILDQNTAWQLFGSYDIVGQPITIGAGAAVHTGVIAGVIESEKGWMNKQAGAASRTVYLSYEMLDQFGTNGGINSYEIVLPNPISGFAREMVTDNIGVEEEQIQIVENTFRFSVWNLLKVLRGFGTRSMNSKAIIYPYWENVARGWEDVLALFLVIEIVLFAGAILCLRRFWREYIFELKL